MLLLSLIGMCVCELLYIVVVVAAVVGVYFCSESEVWDERSGLKKKMYRTQWTAYITGF